MDRTEQLLQPVCALAREAGERILDVYRRDFQVDLKEDRTPLTEADRAAHRVLARGLAELTPDWPVLSEEGGLPEFSRRRSWDRYWLVDPLDGTREFVKRNGEFTVNVALIEGHRPVLGVVHAPVLECTWFGARGSGAFREQRGETRPIATRRAGSGPLTVVVSRSHRGEAVDALLARLPEHDTRSVGSSLKFCLVAQGEADLYPRFGPTSEWDTAAAQCVVECAGGAVSRVDLTPLAYNTKESLLNPDFLVLGDPGYDWAPCLEGFSVESR